MKELSQCSIKASEKVAGKNCIFLVGKTGAGKTTLMYFIAGKQLSVVEDYEIPKKQEEEGIIELE